MLRKAVLLVGAVLVGGSASAQQGEPVPEIHFLSWPAATYSHFAETSNYVVEEWKNLDFVFGWIQSPFLIRSQDVVH